MLLKKICFQLAEKCMLGFFSEEPKGIRCLASVDIRYEYPISLPQSYSLIHQNNCQKDLICSHKIIICLELST